MIRIIVGRVILRTGAWLLLILCVLCKVAGFLCSCCYGYSVYVVGGAIEKPENPIIIINHQQLRQNPPNPPLNPAPPNPTLLLPEQYLPP